LINNSARNSGGGSYGEKLVNCTVVSNSVIENPGGQIGGGGVGNATVVANSIVYFNNAPTFPNYYDAPMVYSCTMPASTGAGNITNMPLFLDPANDNYRLQLNSRCINSGKNSYVKTSTDFDGEPRISGTTVDMGALEFPSPTSTLSYAWAQQYGLSTDGSADFADPDGDGMSNWQESIAGTDPTNSLSLAPKRVTTVLNV
jgi:hypothetical protein